MVSTSQGATSLMTAVGQLPDSERTALAKELGYRKIGKELPNDVTLQDIIKSLPSEVFELNPLRAWGAVLTTLVSVAASVYMISVSPWYLLPFAWMFAGTAFTGVSQGLPVVLCFFPSFKLFAHLGYFSLYHAVFCGWTRLRPQILQQKQAFGRYCGHINVHASYLSI